MYDGTNAKAWKTLTWLYCPDLFKSMLIREIGNLEKTAAKQGLIPGVRLNGSSDVVWERSLPEVFERFSGVQFYDYTKVWKRFDRVLPANYYLVFSRSETNSAKALELVRQGINVAVVFRDLGTALRIGYWQGVRVIDGDQTDCRPMDAKGVIVGLSVKGWARDDTGFFIHN